MKSRKGLLQLLSVLFIIGGVVRLYADRALFELFRMGALWVDHPYFIYIYKVLGAFVILTGLVLFAISKDPGKYSLLYHTLTSGFVLIGLVMLVTGIMIKLPAIFYFPDFLFCFIVAWFIYGARARPDRDDGNRNSK